MATELAIFLLVYLLFLLSLKVLRPFLLLNKTITRVALYETQTVYFNEINTDIANLVPPNVFLE